VEVQEGEGKRVKSVALPGIGSKELGMVRDAASDPVPSPMVHRCIKQLSFIHPSIHSSIRLPVYLSINPSFNPSFNFVSVLAPCVCALNRQ
jgi:hypothetical protein